MVNKVGEVSFTCPDVSARDVIPSLKILSNGSGRWTYLYRAADRHGLTVDFLLSEHRDIASAMQFFTVAIERHGTPDRITLDGYPATHSAVAELRKSGSLRPQMKVRTIKYLNNRRAT